MQKYTDVVQDKRGSVVAGASVLVKDKTTNGPAVVYALNGEQQLPNPMPSDNLGGFSFYAANGRYDIEVSFGAELLSSKFDVLLFDPADEQQELDLEFAKAYTNRDQFDESKDSDNRAAVLEGFVAAGDGGGNLFARNDADTTSPDDGVRTISIAGGGRWRSLLNLCGVEVKLPDGFPYTPLLKIIRDVQGYSVDKDIRELMPSVSGATYYVDIVTGSNANDGSAGSPLRSIQAALGKSDVSIVKVAPGHYGHTDNWGSVFPAGRHFIVERWEGVRQGPVINSTAVDGLAWTVNGTHSNVYQANRTLACGVMDYSRNRRDGTPYRYQEVASLALCASTDGSWYTDGSIVYVNTLENAPPHKEIRVFLLAAGAYFQTAFTVMVDGIEFHGGREPFYPSNTSGAGGMLLAKNCKFLYSFDSTRGNGVRLEGVGQAYLQRCESSYNMRDGYNYHAIAGNVPKVVEIDCRAFCNGQTGDGNNNASSMHDGGTIIRIGGEYAYSEGPNVVDVNSPNSFNAGVYSHDSRLGQQINTNADFYISGGSMWLLECKSSGSYMNGVATNSGQLNLCLTPMRRTAASPTFYAQKLGAVVA